MPPSDDFTGTEPIILVKETFFFIQSETNEMPPSDDFTGTEPIILVKETFELFAKQTIMVSK